MVRTLALKTEMYMNTQEKECTLSQSLWLNNENISIFIYKDHNKAFYQKILYKEHTTSNFPV